MSALLKSLHPDEKIKAGKLGSQHDEGRRRYRRRVPRSSRMILGSMHGDHWKRFLYAYVIGWSLHRVSISIGMMWLVLLHHLVRGRWVTACAASPRRCPHAFPIIFIAGLGFVMPVRRSATRTSTTGRIPTRTTRRSTRTCAQARLAIAGVLRAALRDLRRRASRHGGVLREEVARARRERRPEDLDQLRVASGPAMILYSFVDLRARVRRPDVDRAEVVLDDLRRQFWGSGNVAAFAALALVVLWLQRNGRLVHSVTEEHYHDIGKWMFSFTFFWAYTRSASSCCSGTATCRKRPFGTSTGCSASGSGFPLRSSSATGPSRSCSYSRWTKRIVPDSCSSRCGSSLPLARPLLERDAELRLGSAYHGNAAIVEGSADGPDGASPRRPLGGRLHGVDRPRRRPHRRHRPQADGQPHPGEGPDARDVSRPRADPN